MLNRLVAIHSVCIEENRLAIGKVGHICAHSERPRSVQAEYFRFSPICVSASVSGMHRVGIEPTTQ
jgi:hypothetical protein